MHKKDEAILLCVRKLVSIEGLGSVVLIVLCPTRRLY